ncbi:MAG: hypothetical protein N3B21_00030 [Clostridia bacterium]|nr:hypothetical protein [Clostridia bacterium]
MLKKLFISLLILSALASDGAINLPGNISELYISLGNILALPEEHAELIEQLQSMENENALVNNAFQYNAFKLSANSINKLKTKSVPLSFSFNSGEKFYLACSNINPISISLYKSEKEIIIKKSDSSPPYFTI